MQFQRHTTSHLLKGIMQFLNVSFIGGRFVIAQKVLTSPCESLPSFFFFNIERIYEVCVLQYFTNLWPNKDSLLQLCSADLWKFIHQILKSCRISLSHSFHKILH